MEKKYIKKLLPFLGLLIVVILFFILTAGKILEFRNLKLIVEQSILVMVVSIGVFFVMSMGELDFSVGSILGMASIIAVLTAKISIPLAFLAVILVGVLIGFFNGFLNIKLGISSFIVTICSMVIFRGLIIYFTSSGALQVPFEVYELDELIYKLPLLLILLALGFITFKYTAFGRSCRAIGSGSIAAAYSGIKVNFIKLSAFCLSGALAGAAAFFNIVRVGTATANTGQFLETNVLIALVLGGLPTTGGARSRFVSIIIGSFLLAFLANGLVLIGVGITTQQLIKGIIFLLAVAFIVDRKSGFVSK